MLLHLVVWGPALDTTDIALDVAFGQLRVLVKGHPVLFAGQQLGRCCQAVPIHVEPRRCTLRRNCRPICIFDRMADST